MGRQADHGAAGIQGGGDVWKLADKSPGIHQADEVLVVIFGLEKSQADRCGAQLPMLCEQLFDGVAHAGCLGNQLMQLLLAFAPAR